MALSAEAVEACLGELNVLAKVPLGPQLDVLLAPEDPCPGELATSDEAPLSCLAQAVTDDVLLRLHREGYAVVDGALPEDLCRQLQAEMDELLARDQMWGSESFSGNEGAAHRGIVETSLDYREVPEYAPTFALIEQDHTLLHALRRLPALRGLDMQHVRLQVNKGLGGCYTMHTDSGAEGGRQVLRATALFYLNRAWQTGDGGELRLYPYPRPPVAFPPMDGRLVLFEPRMVHEVLPSYKQRYCFTLWCAATSADASGGPPEPDLDYVTDMAVAADAALDFRRRRGLPIPEVVDRLTRPLLPLFLPEVRPLLVRYVYRHREAEAALRSHEDGPQKEVMMEGIARYHREMEEANPKWFRDLLEALPHACVDPGTVAEEEEGEAGAAAAAALDPCQRACTRDLVEAMRRHCGWWDQRPL